MNQESNLMKLFMHGFNLRVKADVSKKFLKEIRTRLIKGLGPILNEMVPDKFLNFVIKAVKGLQARVKMSPEETYGLFKSHFEGLDLPDGADLVDEIGIAASQGGLFHYYDNVPFVKHMIDSLHDIAECDVEIGYTSEQRTGAVNFHTKGIRELFDLIMAGCVEQ